MTHVEHRILLLFILHAISSELNHCCVCSVLWRTYGLALVDICVAGSTAGSQAEEACVDDGATALTRIACDTVIGGLGWRAPVLSTIVISKHMLVHLPGKAVSFRLLVSMAAQT